MQKNKNRSSSYNSYKERKNVIKIQAVWRGYFLRKIAVGSIKKYIGFVALMKYSEKIIYDNKKYIYDMLINLLKKYNDDKNSKYKYRRINKANYFDKNNNEKNNNNVNKRFHRNFLISQDKNDKKDNNPEKILFKNNYLFNNVEFEPLKNSVNDIKRNSENNKKGVTIYFINKENEKEREKEKEREREKEQKNKKEIDNEKKEVEKRRLEKEKRQKEQINREKEKEKEKKD